MDCRPREPLQLAGEDGSSQHWEECFDAGELSGERLFDADADAVGSGEAFDKPTKASRRGSTSAIRLEEFLSNSGGFPDEWGEWAFEKLGWGCHALNPSGRNSATTGPAATPCTAVVKQTGPQPGALTVVVPRSAAEAEATALALVGHSLPPRVQAFLAATEQHTLVALSVGGKAPAVPELTAEEKAIVCQSVRSLSDILRPALERGPELEIVILKLFAGFNVFTGDEGKLKAQVAVWGEELEEFPLYAIRKAAKWAVRAEARCLALPPSSLKSGTPSAQTSSSENAC